MKQVIRCSRILQLNDYPNWKACVNNFKADLEKDVKRHPSSIVYYILNDLGVGNNNNDYLKLSKSLKADFEITKTKTENKIGDYLKLLKYDIIEQFQIDNYTVDYFIKDKNLIVEYFGPVHFYPLQTQIDQMSKFRLKYLNNKGFNVVVIPHFEFERCSTDTRALNYLQKLINKWVDFSDIGNNALFYENYDMFKLIQDNKI
jgi:very-short-patch-repair endonuclease